MAIIILLDQFR